MNENENDPVAAAIARASHQNANPGMVDSSFGNDHLEMSEAPPVIRMPANKPVTAAARDDTYLDFNKVKPSTSSPVLRPKAATVASAQLDVDLTGVRAAGLDDTTRVALLDKLLSSHNAHTDARRELELERDKVDVENKKLFGKLGFGLAAAGGAVFLMCLLFLVFLTVYATAFDKQTNQAGTIASFLNAFVEVLKQVFTLI